MSDYFYSLNMIVALLYTPQNRYIKLQKLAHILRNISNEENQ